MYKTILYSTIVCMSMTHCSTPAETTSKTCADTLRNAVQHANSFFVKVHAGEALALNNDTEGLEAAFTKLRDEDPGHLIGATRVLARVNRNNPEQYNACIDVIIDQFLHADSSHPRLVALESLGKLGYSQPMPEIVQQAQNGEGGFKAMARWVLSNNGAPDTEDSLAALLASPEVADYRGASYALRFKQSIQPATLQKLEALAKGLAPDASGRVYVLSAHFVHHPNNDTKQALLAYLKGVSTERYEVAEALSLKGSTEDLPVLQTLLADEDNDVRVAAANAIIKINARNATH
jgi:FOG: HEAT repeat